MIQTSCTLESVSGSDLNYIENVKTFISNTLVHKNKIRNLIDYLLYCDGEEIVHVYPPKDIHKEALKIKALYPKVNVEIINTIIRISV
jgi:hypothetical protein